MYHSAILDARHDTAAFVADDEFPRKFGFLMPLRSCWWPANAAPTVLGGLRPPSAAATPGVMRVAAIVSGENVSRRHVVVDPVAIFGGEEIETSRSSECLSLSGPVKKPETCGNPKPSTAFPARWGW